MIETEVFRGAICGDIPDVELAREFEEKYRWCFGCRRRVRYNWILKGYSEPSYYEPVWVCRCPWCAQDGCSGGFWYEGPPL